jgi:hypothetical protein
MSKCGLHVGQRTLIVCTLQSPVKRFMRRVLLRPRADGGFRVYCFFPQVPGINGAIEVDGGAARRVVGRPQAAAMRLNE